MASDCETVQELLCDLRWRAASGLGLHDTAFDPSLLAYFRRRLARTTRPERTFDAVREVVKATGVLTGHHRRALDSAVLDDAVATQDTITQLITAVRTVIRHLPGAAQLAASCTATDYTTTGKPPIAWNDEHARADLVDALVKDALHLLEHLPAQDPDDKAAHALGLLALISGQDVEPDGDGRWRIARRTVVDRVVSTVDRHSRHVHKTRSHHQEGYKAHLAVEPSTGLFTAVTPPPGAGAAHQEFGLALPLLADEEASVDVFRRQRLLRRSNPPSPAAGRSPVVRQTATVEEGRSRRVQPRRPRHRHHRRHGDLPRRAPGPAESAQGPLPAAQSVLHQPVHRLPAPSKVHHGRIRADLDHPPPSRRPGRRPPTSRHRPRLADRLPPLAPPVERAVAWLVHRGNRRLRYIGTTKNNAWLHTRAAALNLRTLVSLGLHHDGVTWRITAMP